MRELHSPDKKVDRLTEGFSTLPEEIFTGGPFREMAARVEGGVIFYIG
jgi:hypothetical protein